MHISANIIRFPEIPATHHAELHAPAPQPPAEVVEFPFQDTDVSFDERAQQHGQLHSAHRIVARLADQIDGIAVL